MNTFVFQTEHRHENCIAEVVAKTKKEALARLSKAQVKNPVFLRKEPPPIGEIDPKMYGIKRFYSQR